MIAPTTGVDQVLAPAALAFRIQAFALPRHVTVLFWATYAVQLPPANPRSLPVYLTRYRSLSPVLDDMMTGDFCSILVSLVSRIWVAHLDRATFVGSFSVFAITAGDLDIAPGIIRSIPIRILAASRSLLIDTISVVSTLYFAEIAEIVSPFTTVCTTPEIGGILSICPILSSSVLSRSLAQRIASVLTPYLFDILLILSSFATVCFLMFLSAISGATRDSDGTGGIFAPELSPPIRMSPVSDIYPSPVTSSRSLYAVMIVDSS
jgi:hypothetical protein